jgi:hypothetical protein
MAKSPRLVVAVSFYKRFTSLTLRFQRFQRPGKGGHPADALSPEGHTRIPSSNKREVRDEALSESHCLARFCYLSLCLFVVEWTVPLRAQVACGRMRAKEKGFTAFEGRFFLSSISKGI